MKLNDNTIYKFIFNVKVDEKIVERSSTSCYYPVIADELYMIKVSIVDEDDVLINFKGDKVSLMLIFQISVIDIDSTVIQDYIDLKCKLQLNYNNYLNSNKNILSIHIILIIFIKINLNINKNINLNNLIFINFFKTNKLKLNKTILYL